jgi:hypothetical protein
MRGDWFRDAGLSATLGAKTLAGNSIMLAMTGTSPRATCVVIDCNTWSSHYWLGSPVGQTLIAALRQDPLLYMAIPEVLGTELDKHRSKSATEMLQKLRQATDNINTVMGGIGAGIVTLDEAAIEVAARDRLTPVLGKIKYPEMTLGEVRCALEMVNSEAPPNGPKNQQMKDSLLWQACISLAVDHDVYFISADNGFYSSKNLKNDLASNLAKYSEVTEGRLKVFRSLHEALAEISPTLSVDSVPEHQGVDIDGAAAGLADEALARSVIARSIEGVKDLRGVHKTYLKTGTAHIFAVSFTVFYDYRQQPGDANIKNEVAVSGECLLDTRSGDISQLTLEKVNWKTRSPNGKHTWAEESPLDSDATGAVSGSQGRP